MTNPSLTNCLARLGEAYGLDFEELAARIQFWITVGVRDDIKRMALDVIRASRGIESLSTLAHRLEKVYLATEADNESRTDKNRLAFIVTVFMLEQKALLVAADGTGLKPSSASSVRREFFAQLQGGDRLAKIRRDVGDFLADHDNLRNELESQAAESDYLRLSGLCFDDIPGAVASAEYRQALHSFSEQYGVDFAQFIEAIGDSRTHGYSFLMDPVQEAMTELGMKGCQRIELSSDDSYLDRNAKLVITAMHFFQGQVFGANTQQPAQALTGKKRPPESSPVQESSVIDEKIAEVRRRFIQFLLSACNQVARADTRKNVETHVREEWPKGLLPGKS